MTLPTEPWGELQDDWQSTATPLNDVQLRQRSALGQRRMRRTRAAAGAFALIAVTGVSLAWLHSPSTVDFARGGLVIALIVLAWWIDQLRWHAHSRALTRSTHSFLEVARQRGIQQLRAVHLAWIIMVAELGFLLPWWIDGYRYHTNELFAPISLASIWLPSLIMLVMLVWTLRLRRALLAELTRLNQVMASAESS